MIKSRKDLKHWLEADSKNYQNVLSFKPNWLALSPISD